MSLFVGNLPEDMRTSELKDLFYKYGKITFCQMKSGFGFVDFDDSRDAEDAIRDLDNITYRGDRIRVEWTRGRGPPRGSSVNSCQQASSTHFRNFIVVNTLQKC